MPGEGQRYDYGIVLGASGRAPSAASSPRNGKIVLDVETGAAHGIINRWARKNVTFADDGTTVTIRLPAKSVVTDCLVEVVTAFDGDTTNTIEVGDGSDANGFAATSMADLTTLGLYGVNDDDRGVYLYDSTGGDRLMKYYSTTDTVDIPVVSTASATAGECNVFIGYFVLDDLDPTV